jgi:6-phosphogluconolactonase (cycloisomerase 2 family)
VSRKGIFGLAVLAGVVTVLAGAGPAAASHKDTQQNSTHAVFVQTNRAAGNTVKVFERADDGTLSSAGPEVATGGLGGATVGAPGDSLSSQGSLVFSDGLLFAVNAGSNTVSVLRVDGLHLTLLQQISSGGLFPVSIAVRDDLAFVVNGGGTGAIQGYRIHNGMLHMIPGDNRPLGLNNTTPPAFPTSPGQVGISPNGQWAFVTMKAFADTTGNNIINTFRIDNNDVLSASPVASPSVSGVPFSFTFQTPNRLVVAEAGVSEVTTYKRVGQGHLTPIGSAQNGQVATCWIQQVDGFYFTTNTGSDTVSSYRVEPNGQPVLRDAAAATTAAAPIDMTESAGFLYVESGQGGFVDVYAVSNTGSLTLLQTASDGLPAFANGIGIEGIAAS